MMLSEMIAHLNKISNQLGGDVEVETMQECEQARIQVQSKVTGIAYNGSKVIIIGHECD